MIEDLLAIGVSVLYILFKKRLERSFILFALISWVVPVEV